MSTINQIEANRQNAKKSTGPRSKAGKAKVSLNALKHGLLAKTARLPDEDEETFRIFADDLLTDLQPVGAVESLLAEEIINLAWRLRRDGASQSQRALPTPTTLSWPRLLLRKLQVTLLLTEPLFIGDRLLTHEQAGFNQTRRHP
jgi:hypothetical protein